MQSTKTLRVALAAFAVVLVGCGDAAPVGDLDAPAPSTTEPVAAPTTAGRDGDAGATAATAVPDDRPPAPDFTLSLEPEGEFVLADAGKPVYLVFWAEW